MLEQRSSLGLSSETLREPLIMGPDPPGPQNNGGAREKPPPIGKATRGIPMTRVVLGHLREPPGIHGGHAQRWRRGRRYCATPFPFRPPHQSTRASSLHEKGGGHRCAAQAAALATMDDHDFEAWLTWNASPQMLDITKPHGVLNCEASTPVLQTPFGVRFQ